jgi:cold shock CspA family protein/ribosome-associated translation inhibitor RaiA
MQVPLQVSFRNMDASDAVEADVAEKVRKLEEVFDRIISCRVVVEAPHRRHHKGNLYAVSIDITVPGDEIVVQRSGPVNPAHADVYVAVRDAFSAAGRRLQDFARIARGDVKSHATPLHGEIVRLHGDGEYGFIRTSDGGDVYFHRNSVVDGRFEDLVVGQQVRLVLAYGESEHGPQASTVKAVGKHHLIG